MSYARLSEESDVYVWPDTAGRIICSWCGLKEGDLTASGMLVFTSAGAAVRHLEEHIAVGDRVPERAFRELRQDRFWLWRSRIASRFLHVWKWGLE